MVTPNGIGLSPDGNTLYVAETESARLWAFAIREPGVLEKEGWPSPHGGRMVVASPGGQYQRFDSLAVEANGSICVATLAHGGITVVAPDGSAFEHVPMPDFHTTNICFGGPELRTAYVTLSGRGELVALDWPRPGLPLEYLNR
jgi:gluconolactonase